MQTLLDEDLFTCTRCDEELAVEYEHCDFYDTVCNYCCGCGCSQI